MTDAQKVAEANKYDRLDKLAEIVTMQILTANRTAINDINKFLGRTYQTNYNEVANGLKMGLNEINKTEAKEELKENPNPFNEIAIENAKDKDQIKRKVKSSILTSIFKAATVGVAFAGLKAIFESNLKSSLTIAITQATEVENMARYDAMAEAEKRAEENGLVLVKIWRTEEDEKVRDAHARAEGQEAKVDEPFYVGGERLMYPGDINGSASNIINCRCHIEYDFVKK